MICIHCHCGETPRNYVDCQRLRNFLRFEPPCREQVRSENCSLTFPSRVIRGIRFRMLVCDTGNRWRPKIFSSSKMKRRRVLQTSRRHRQRYFTSADLATKSDPILKKDLSLYHHRTTLHRSADPKNAPIGHTEWAETPRDIDSLYYAQKGPHKKDHGSMRSES